MFRPRMLVALVAVIIGVLVTTGGPAGAVAWSKGKAPAVAWSKGKKPNVAWSGVAPTHPAATAAQARAEQARTLKGFGMKATPGANGTLKSAAMVHPADVPAYYHRCWSFIDATFHVNTRACPGDVYRFSTYDGTYEYFDAQFIAQHAPYNSALRLEQLCYHNWACATTLNASKSAALFKGYKLVWQGSKIAWNWFKIGWEWFCGLYCDDAL